MKAPNLSLVVLAFNEEANVASFLQECLRYLDTLEGEHEIIVVDDGSSDATAARAGEVAAEDARVRIVSHGVNRGMGAGMRTGFENARGDYLCALPADGQVPAREIDKLLPHLQHSAIVLSVYSRRANQRHRKLVSLGFRSFMRLVLGTSFKLEGIYLFPVAVARNEIGLEKIAPDTFFFSFELISRALALGYRAHTVTIDPLPRQSGRSKVFNPRRIGKVAAEVLDFRLRLSRESARTGASSAVSPSARAWRRSR